MYVFYYMLYKNRIELRLIELHKEYTYVNTLTYMICYDYYST